MTILFIVTLKSRSCRLQVSYLDLGLTDTNLVSGWWTINSKKMMRYGVKKVGLLPLFLWTEYVNNVQKRIITDIHKG